MLHAGGRRFPGRRIRVNRDNKVHSDAPGQEITGRIRVMGRLWCAIGPLILPGARILPANSPGRAADGADGNSVTRAGVAVRVSDAGAEAITTAVRVRGPSRIVASRVRQRGSRIIVGRNSLYRGCRTTSPLVLSSQTSGTYRPRSDRPIRTVDHVPGANWGLTPSGEELRDSLYQGNLVHDDGRLSCVGRHRPGRAGRLAPRPGPRRARPAGHRYPRPSLRRRAARR